MAYTQPNTYRDTEESGERTLQNETASHLKSFSLTLLLVTSALLAEAPVADAATAGATMLVSATVLSGCVVAATPLAFGNYSGTATGPTDATSTITATCSNGVHYTVSGDAGAGTGATVAARTMTDGSDTLAYLLYKDTARTSLWGDGTNSTTTEAGTAGLLPQTYTIYGRIPALQHVEAGLYTDTVNVTLNY